LSLRERWIIIAIIIIIIKIEYFFGEMLINKIINWSGT